RRARSLPKLQRTPVRLNRRAKQNPIYPVPLLRRIRKLLQVRVTLVARTFCPSEPKLTDKTSSPHSIVHTILSRAQTQEQRRSVSVEITARHLAEMQFPNSWLKH